MGHMPVSSSGAHCMAGPDLDAYISRSTPPAAGPGDPYLLRSPPREHPGQETTPSPRTAPPPTWGARIGRLLCWFATFNFVSFLWVFFRAEMQAGLLRFSGPSLLFPNPAPFRVPCRFGHPGRIGYSVLGAPCSRFLPEGPIRLPVPLQGLTVAILCIIILKMGPEGVLPFIYFQF